MPKSDPSLKALRRQLRNDERGGSDRDRRVLLSFSEEMGFLQDTYGPYRHQEHLRCCCEISEKTEVDIAEALYNPEATQEILRWINDTYDPNERREANQEYRLALYQFGRCVDDVHGNDSPSSITTALDEDDVEWPVKLEECPDCGRFGLPERIHNHEC